MPKLQRGEYVDVTNDALFLVGGTIAFLLASLSLSLKMDGVTCLILLDKVHPN